MPARKRLLLAAGAVLLAGICAGHGKPVTFHRFLRYGLSITALPLAVSALYVLALFLLGVDWRLIGGWPFHRLPGDAEFRYFDALLGRGDPAPGIIWRPASLPIDRLDVRKSRTSSYPIPCGCRFYLTHLSAQYMQYIGLSSVNGIRPQENTMVRSVGRKWQDLV